MKNVANEETLFWKAISMAGCAIMSYIVVFVMSSTISVTALSFVVTRIEFSFLPVEYLELAAKGISAFMSLALTLHFAPRLFDLLCNWVIGSEPK